MPFFKNNGNRVIPSAKDGSRIDRIEKLLYKINKNAISLRFCLQDNRIVTINSSGKDGALVQKSTKKEQDYLSDFKVEVANLVESFVSKLRESVPSLDCDILLRTLNICFEELYRSDSNREELFEELQKIDNIVEIGKLVSAISFRKIYSKVDSSAESFTEFLPLVEEIEEEHTSIEELLGSHEENGPKRSKSSKLKVADELEGKIDSLRSHIGNGNISQIKNTLSQLKIREAILGYKARIGHEAAKKLKKLLKSKKTSFVLDGLPDSFVALSDNEQKNILSLLSEKSISIQPKELIRQAVEGRNNELLSYIIKKYNLEMKDTKESEFIVCQEENYASLKSIIARAYKINASAGDYLLSAGNLLSHIVLNEGYKGLVRFKKGIRGEIDSRVYEGSGVYKKVLLSTLLNDEKSFMEFWGGLSDKVKNSLAKDRSNNYLLPMQVARLQTKNFEAFLLSLSSKTREEIFQYSREGEESLMLSIIQAHPKLFVSSWKSVSKEAKQRLAENVVEGSLSLPMLVATGLNKEFGKFWHSIPDKKSEKLIYSADENGWTIAMTLASSSKQFGELWNSISEESKHDLAMQVGNDNNSLAKIIVCQSSEIFNSFWTDLPEEVRDFLSKVIDNDNSTLAASILRHDPSKFKEVWDTMSPEAQKISMNCIDRNGYSLAALIAINLPEEFEEIWDQVDDETQANLNACVTNKGWSLAMIVARCVSNKFNNYWRTIPEETKEMLMSQLEEGRESLAMIIISYVSGDAFVNIWDALSEESRSKIIEHSNNDNFSTLMYIAQYKPQDFMSIWMALPDDQKEDAVTKVNSLGLSLAAYIVKFDENDYTAFSKNLSPATRVDLLKQKSVDGECLVATIADSNPDIFKDIWTQSNVSDRIFMLTRLDYKSIKVATMAAITLPESFSSIWQAIPDSVKSVKEAYSVTSHDGKSLLDAVNIKATPSKSRGLLTSASKKEKNRRSINKSIVKEAYEEASRIRPKSGFFR